MSWLKRLFGLEQDPDVQIVSVNDENYQETIVKSPLPVMLDLWAPSCTHCKPMVPIMTSLAKKYKGQVRFAECDISNNPEIARKLRIRGTPTVVFFKKGKEIERAVGFKGSLYHTEIIETEFLGNEFKL